MARHWIALCGVMLVLAVAGSWLWHTANAGLALIEADVDAAVNADLWPETHSVADVQLLDLTDDVAVADVALPPVAGRPALRQTRVYRRSGAGRVRTAPSAAPWRMPRRLETSYFVFHYADQDSEAVQAAAAKLDSLYPALFTAFLPAAPTGEKLVVQVDPAQPPGGDRHTRHRARPLGGRLSSHLPGAGGDQPSRPAGPVTRSGAAH
jgi:hypothetical protein